MVRGSSASPATIVPGPTVARLGEVGGEDAVAVGADHGALEPRRHGELRHHHGKQREDEHHGEEGEAALAAHQLVTGTETMSGGCSTARPACTMVNVASMEIGRAFSFAASQRSVHSPLRSLR